MARSAPEDADENRAGAEAAGRPRAEACLSLPSLRAPEWWRPRGGLVAAGLAPLSVRRGARAARGAEPREAEGAEAAAVATVARVLRLLTRRPAPPLPPARPPAHPPRAAAPSPSAPRGFLQTSARVSGGRGPLRRSAGGLFLCLFLPQLLRRAVAYF